MYVKGKNSHNTTITDNIHGQINSCYYYQLFKDNLDF